MGVGGDDDQRARTDAEMKWGCGGSRGWPKPRGGRQALSLLVPSYLFLHLTNDDQRESDGFQLFH